MVGVALVSRQAHRLNVYLPVRFEDTSEGSNAQWCTYVCVCAEFGQLFRMLKIIYELCVVMRFGE